MAGNEIKLGELGEFYCTVSSNGQIFIPVKMRKVMDIAANDVVKFSVQEGGKVLFTKDVEASKNEPKPGSRRGGQQKMGTAQ